MKTFTSFFKTKLLLLFSFLLLSSLGWGQTQIYVLDFETSGGYTTSMSEQTDNSSDYFTRTNGSDISGNYYSPQGSYFFAAQDLDADGMSSSATLSIDDINISGYSNLELRVYLAEDDDGTDQDWDDDDYLHIDYDIDNTGSFNNGIWVENDGSTYNSAPYIDTDYDGDGEGTEITDTFTQFTKSISGTGSLLDIKITFGALTSSEEDIAIDHIEIWGTASGPTITTTPTSLTSFTYLEGNGPSGEQSFTVEGSNLTNNITITPPTNWEISTGTGGSFVATNPITLTQSGGTVNSTTIYTRMVSGLLNANSPFSGNISCTSNGATQQDVAVDGTVTLACTEPNLATNISFANITASAIDVSWTASSGGADNYLVVQSTNSSLSSSPADGTTYAVNDALGDGTVVFNGSTTSFTATGLSANTTYYYYVFAYNDTNCSGGPNYTTSSLDGNATTLNGPVTLYSGSFEDGDETWTYISNGGTADWVREDDGGSYSPGDTGNDGTYYAWFYGYNNDAEDWLISPSYDFSGYSNVIMNFWSWMRNTGPNVEMKISNNYVSGDPTSATWEDLSPTLATSDQSWTASGDVDLSTIADGQSNVHIAFYYTGSDVDRNWAIDDYNLQAVLASTSDQTSEALAPGTQGSASQILASTISSTKDTPAEAINVFNFEIYDDASADGAITDVTQITIRNANPANGADWTNNIQGIRLYNATTSSDVTIGSVTITDTEITIPISSSNLTIADGGFVDLTMSVYLNTSNIEDGKQLQFMIDADNHGFVAVTSTSRFNSVFTSDVNSNIFIIDVDATKIVFSPTEPPSIGSVNVNFPVTVNAVDDNGNLDVNNSNSVTLSKASGSGNMVGGAAQNLSLGTYTWNVNFDASDVYTITATTSGLTTSNTVTSNNIDITNVFKFQGFDSASRDNWTYSASYTDSNSDVHTTSGGSISSSDITTNSGTVIHPYNGSGTNNSNDGNSWKMVRADVLVMDNVDLSNYINVKFSFTFAGEDVGSGDELKLKVSYDGGLTWVKIEPFTDSGSYPEGGDFIADGYSGADWDFGVTNNPSTGDFHPQNPFVLNIDDTKTQFIAEIYTGQYYYVDEVQLEGTFVPLTITTLNFMGATQTTAIVNADLENFGGETVTERGIVWDVATNPSPTTGSNLGQYVDAGTGLGYYTADDTEITGLTAGTTYKARAYVITNESGTVYGNELSFTTCNGAEPCLNNKDLLISEYIESSCGGTNNAIEIFNGTGSTVNLKHYRLQHDNGGSYETYTNAYDFLDFDLPNNQTFVITNLGSNATEFALKINGGQADVQDNVASLSGDEQIQLLKTTDNYQNYAVIEHVGAQYNWGEVKTFARNPDITSPKVRTVVGDNTCDPNTNEEWIVYPDCYYDDLGSHRVDFDWEGDVDGDWFKTQNWNLDRVPTRSATSTIADVVTAGVGVFPVITDDGSSRIAEAYKLVIKSGAKVTIAPSGDMSITGSISNSAGASGLVMQSGETGTASLILAGLGGISTQATVERYLESNKYSFIFSPLTNVDGPSILTTNSEMIFSYNETTADYWDNNGIYGTSGWVSGVANPMSLEKGYVIKPNANTTYSFTGGDLEVANKTFTLTYTNNGTGDAGNLDDDGSTWDEFDGWNIIGNPYTSAIDWNYTSADWDKSKIENFVYYYDEGNYQCYGASPYDQGITLSSTNTGMATQYIPSGQAFFVKANSSGGDITIPQAARIHNNQTFWKKTCNVSKTKSLVSNLLRLNISNSDFYDELIIRTLPNESGVTEDHDGLYDAYKIFSLDNLKPQLFTKSLVSDKIFAVNSLPEFTKNKIIPLGMYVGESGEYSINLTENNFKNMHLWLEDRTLSVNTNLLNNSSYTFSQTAETNNNRFYLHLEHNQKPFVNAHIPNQETEINEMYSYAIPSNIFSDNNFEDNLTLSAKLSTGEELPNFLSFNREIGVISGVPNLAENLNIRIIATDIFGEFVYDDYMLNIKNAVSVQDVLEQQISIFPNPSYNNIILTINNFKNFGTYKIVNIGGKILFNGDINSAKTEIDISKLSKGIYIIEINVNNLIIMKRIVKE